MQERHDRGETVAAIDRKPDLSDQPDLAKLFSNFMTLSQTRQAGFSGPGNLQLADILMLYEVESWTDAGMDARDYLQTMLFLDSALRQYHDERKPRGK